MSLDLHFITICRAKKYLRIYRLSIAVEREINISIRNGLKNVLVDGRTLLDYLKTKPIDHHKIIYVAKHVENKLAGSTGQTKHSLNEQRRKTRLVSKAG